MPEKSKQKRTLDQKGSVPKTGAGTKKPKATRINPTPRKKQGKTSQVPKTEPIPRGTRISIGQDGAIAITLPKGTKARFEGGGKVTMEGCGLDVKALCNLLHPKRKR